MFGNLPPHPAVMQALQDVIASGVYNGYDHSSGNMATRKAVAQLFSRYSEKNQLSYEVCTCIASTEDFRLADRKKFMRAQLRDPFKTLILNRFTAHVWKNQPEILCTS